MKKVLVIAPHPDDETLGCGGTILKHIREGHQVYWLIGTKIDKNSGWNKETVEKRAIEIRDVAEKYGFKDTIQFDITTTALDLLPTAELISKISQVQKKVTPEIIYLPFYNDVHSDHRLIADGFQATIKWFRHNYVKKVLMYEIVSETDFVFMRLDSFKPNVYCDISEHIEKKIEIMKIYKSENGDFPFPRSEETIRALATLRGSQSGFMAAEAFQLVFERL